MLMQISQAANGAGDIEAACRMKYDRLILFNCIDNAVNSSVFEYQKKELEKLKQK